jgi:hypothetical protein
MPTATPGCKHASCKQSADGGKGYCGRHYSAWKRGELPKRRYKTCRVEACRKPIVARGRCEEHFARDYPGKRPTEAAAAPAA